MAIKIKGNFSVTDSDKAVGVEAVIDQISNLLPGDYTIYICDQKKNRSVHQLKYLFGVVLKMISAETGGEISDLYRFFERKFSPPRSITVNGEHMIVHDLKLCSSQEMGLIIEQIVEFAANELDIHVPTQDELRENVAQDIYVDAYNNSWNQ